MRWPWETKEDRLIVLLDLALLAQRETIKTHRDAVDKAREVVDDRK